MVARPPRRGNFIKPDLGLTLRRVFSSKPEFLRRKSKTMYLFVMQKQERNILPGAVGVGGNYLRAASTALDIGRKCIRRGTCPLCSPKKGGNKV